MDAVLAPDRVLVRAVNGLLKRQVLFGSDYPMLTPERWLRDFADLQVKDEVRPLVVKENALRALSLSSLPGLIQPVALDVAPTRHENTAVSALAPPDC